MRPRKRKRPPLPPPKRPTNPGRSYGEREADDPERRKLSIGGLAVTLGGLVLIGLALSGLPREFRVDPLLPAAVGLLLVIVGARMLYDPDDPRWRRRGN